METVPAFEDACPVPEQLEVCWPRNRPLDLAIVYAGIPGGLEQLAALGYVVASPPAALPALVALLPRPPEPILHLHPGLPNPGLPAGHLVAGSSGDAPPAASVAAPAEGSVPVAESSAPPTHRLRRKTSGVHSE